MYKYKYIYVFYVQQYSRPLLKQQIFKKLYDRVTIDKLSV